MAFKTRKIGICRVLISFPYCETKSVDYRMRQSLRQYFQYYSSILTDDPNLSDRLLDNIPVYI